MPTIKIPDFSDPHESMIVRINRKPFTLEDSKKLLTEVTLLSAIRDEHLRRQGITIEVPDTFKEDTITVTGLKVATYLAERFKELNVSPKVWQQRVRSYEKLSVWQLDQIKRDLTESIKTLMHTEALQECNRALAYLQQNYPKPQSCLREGELSGMANPDQTVQVVQPDDNGQCPQGTMWSARVGGCVSIEDGNAQTGFDTTPGGNKASSDLRRPRAEVPSRRQFTPEGTKVAMDAGNSDRWHSTSDMTPNLAMGNPEGCRQSDVGIDTEKIPGQTLSKGLSGDMLNRQRESVQEGELSGMANPDQKVEVVPADANGQCKTGWIYSARVGGCVRIDDGTAQTGFDTRAGGNTAASDLRKARASTGRRQFTPEGTDVQLDQGGFNRMHPDNFGTPNRAMGNADAIEVSDKNIDTEQMPGGNRVNDITVQPRMRPTEAYISVSEGELSGLANPDQILRGVDPDGKGQCPSGYLFSALVGKCIPLTVDQQVDQIKKNRTQHSPEGTVTRMGRPIGTDNSDKPNLAMGSTRPLAMLQDEGWFSLSNHYACCMFMLREARLYSYYACKHASERFCFISFEGRNDGYINGHNQLEHMTVFHHTEQDEQALNEWQKNEEQDYNEKTRMDTDYEQLMQQRLHYRSGLTELIRRGRTDQQIQHALEQAEIPYQTIRSLMTDVRILRNTESTYAKPKPRVTIKTGSAEADEPSWKTITRKPCPQGTVWSIHQGKCIPDPRHQNTGETS